MFKPFLLALSLLTRLPVPHIANLQERDHALSSLYHPLVGLVIGALFALFAGLFSASNPVIVAAVIVALWAMITGGLHLDGLADGADAWLGGLGDTEKTHRILKDPVVGSAGVIAIVCVLLMKFAALTVILEQQLYGLLLLAPILGRVFGLGLLVSTSYVRENGLASSMVKLLPKNALMVVLGISATVLLGVHWVAAIATFVMFYAVRRLMIQRLGGCTGDMIGATIEITEMTWLVVIALML